jgi:hypothetical protein
MAGLDTPTLGRAHSTTVAIRLLKFISPGVVPMVE